MLFGYVFFKIILDLVKVKGYLNYYCKLLFLFLIYYGMDKRIGEGKLLSELG